MHPPNANDTTRWITPTGTVVSPEGNNAALRFTVLQGTVEIDRRVVDGTVLLINNLTYEDEGVYVCEALDISDTDAQWVQAVSQLQLLGIHIQ